MWREFVLLVGGSVELVAASWALHASVRDERQGLWRMVLVLWPVGFREHPGCAEYDLWSGVVLQDRGSVDCGTGL